MSVAKIVWRRWSEFWFESDGSRQMDLFRRVFAAILLACYIHRSFDLRLFYSESGIAPLTAMLEMPEAKYRYSLLSIFSGDTALILFNLVFLSSLFGLMVGFRPRVCAVIASALHLSFLHRNIAVMYGADMVANYFLLYLCLADFRRHEERRPGDLRSILGSVAYRLCQIQLCLIYAYSGLHKLKGVTWWKGEAVWTVMANSQLTWMDFSWLAGFPLLLAASTYLTLIWEIYFPALIWIPQIRLFVLAFGVLFHLMIGASMIIPFFVAVMLSTYILFLDAQRIEKIENFFRVYLKRLKFS